MKNYCVTFTCYYNYDVQAEDEDDAIDKAYRKYEACKRRPIADTCYDEVDVELTDDEDDDEEEDD